MLWDMALLACVGLMGGCCCCCFSCAGELEALTTPPPKDQLERAKAMSISLIQGALESKAASAEDLGRQILTYGHRWVEQVVALDGSRTVTEIRDRFVRDCSSTGLTSGI